MGAWSFFGLCLTLIIITLLGGVSYGSIITSFAGFITGDLSSVPDGSDETMIHAVMVILAVMFLDLACMVVILVCFFRVFHDATREYRQSMMKILERGPFVIFKMIVYEELFARGLFLGLGTMVFKSDFAFYLLMIVGNSLWALLHLGNYKARQRSVLKVTPQFVGGLFLSYIFVRYGLFVTIMLNYVYDILLFSLLKAKMPNFSTLFSLGYFSLLGIVLFVITSVNGVGLSTLGPWVNDDIRPLDSLGFWDYANQARR